MNLNDSRRGVGESLSLRMLSSFQVYRNGERLNGTLVGRARQLLKILAANNRKCVPREVLIETIWPDSDPSTAAISLKVAAHNLRGALDPDKKTGSPGNWVIAENGTYRLNPEAEVWIDTEVFHELCRVGRRLEASGDLTAARLKYEEAESLYAGDYLEEDIYEDWTVIRREQLRDLHLNVLGRLAELACHDGLHADVIRYCHKIVLADPCREDAYRMLMQSHGALNQLARAGAWYAVCRVLLQREVGVTPSAETTSVFERLFVNPQDEGQIADYVESQARPAITSRRG